MLTRIHINQHNIKYNKKNNIKKPVITCKTSKTNIVGNKVIIYDKNGVEVASILYLPDKPLKCGAHCWIETRNKICVSQ